MALSGDQLQSLGGEPRTEKCHLQLIITGCKPSAYYLIFVSLISFAVGGRCPWGFKGVDLPPEGVRLVSLAGVAAQGSRCCRRVPDHTQVTEAVVELENLAHRPKGTDQALRQVKKVGPDP